MIVSAIVSMGKNRVIGKNNQLPWKLPLELKYFKETTMGHHMIMGRKSYESIGRPLPGRTSIILTRNKDFLAPGCLIVHSLDEALKLAEQRGEKEVFITGGEEIFKIALPQIKKLYLTEVDFSGEGDAYFPEIDLKNWNLESEKTFDVSEKNPLRWTAKVYSKN